MDNAVGISECPRSAIGNRPHETENKNSSNSLRLTQGYSAFPNDAERWRSVRVIYLTMFLTSVSWSFSLSSLFPYLQVLQPDTTFSFLGWVVAGFSIGKLIASPLVGVWANFRRTREPLLGTLILLFGANILYMYLQSIPWHPEIFLLVTRILMGNYGVLYAFVSSATTLKERTSAMAHLTASLSTGFIIGPLIQAALVPIGHPGPVNAAWFHLDMYTAAALLGALTSAVNIFLLKYAFTEVSVPDEPEDNSDQETQPSPPDYLALVAMVMLYCFILVMFASIETVSTPLCMHMFGWNRADASLYVGITFGVAGVVSIAAFVVIKFIAEWFDDRKLLITGFVFQFISVFCLLPWNKEGPNIDLEFVNASSTTESIGCPGEYDWCHVTPGLNIWQFFLSGVLISIGFPTCNVMTCIIFSKMLGPGKQGKWMGFLTSSGALGKLIGPVFVGYMYQEFGPRITFPSLMGFIFLTVIGVIIIYRRMVPYKRIRELKSYSLSFENRESYDLHTIEDIEKY